jgi:hypothetical protein
LALRITGTAGLDTVPVEHLQRIQDGIGVLGAGATRQRLERAADQLLAVGLSDQHRKDGVLGRDVGEVLLERQPGDHVDDVAEVGALIGAQAQLVADRDALGPLLQGLGLALVGNFEGGHLLFLQPLAHVAQGVLGLVEVDALGAAAGGRCEVLRGCVEGQVTLDGVVQAL